MNHDDLIQAATKDIALGDEFVHDPYGRQPNPIACYLAAIARLLLAQMADASASASPPDHGGTVLDPDRTSLDLVRMARDASASTGLCTVCARPRPCPCDGR